jgi:hypothetical protein
MVARRWSILLTLGLNITALLAAMLRRQRATRNWLNRGPGSWGWRCCCGLIYDGLAPSLTCHSLLRFTAMGGRSGRASMVHSRRASPLSDET